MQTSNKDNRFWRRYVERFYHGSFRKTIEIFSLSGIPNSSLGVIRTQRGSVWICSPAALIRATWSRHCLKFISVIFAHVSQFFACDLRVRQASAVVEEHPEIMMRKNCHYMRMLALALMFSSVVSALSLGGLSDVWDVVSVRFWHNYTATPDIPILIPDGHRNSTPSNATNFSKGPFRADDSVSARAGKHGEHDDVDDPNSTGIDSEHNQVQIFHVVNNASARVRQGDAVLMFVGVINCHPIGSDKKLVDSCPSDTFHRARRRPWRACRPAVESPDGQPYLRRRPQQRERQIQ